MLGDDEVQEICQEIEARFESLTVEEAAAENPPAVLHHYTSSDGLLGIIQTRELWATNVLYLNGQDCRVAQVIRSQVPLRA